MVDIVTARFSYPALDRPENRVRIRLNSTVVNARNTESGNSPIDKDCNARPARKY